MAEESDSHEPGALEVGKTYIARIEDFNESGEGLADLNEHVVFVKGVKAGQDVRIKITKILGRFAFGEVEK